MIVRELITKWGVDVDSKELDKLDKRIGDLSKTMLVVGGAATAAAASLFGIAKFTANAGDQALKASQKFGIGVEALQELQYAAGLADVSNEELGMGLQQLSRRMFEVQKGSAEAAKVFSILGVKTRDASGKLRRSDDVLMEMADRFKALPEGPQKTALAMEVFGKSGVKLLPLFKDGSAGIAELRKEAQAAGVVLGEDAAKQSEEFNDSLTRLFAVMTGLRNELGVALMPVIMEVVQTVRDFILANRELIKTNLEKTAKSWIAVLKVLLMISNKVGRVFLAIADRLTGTERAAKFAFFALLAIASAKLLVGLGSVVMSVATLATAFTGAGNAALLMNAKALLIPLLIGAAFLGLILIIEDVMSFFEGKNSIAGLIVEQFGQLPGFLQQTITAMLTPMRFFITAWQTMFEVLATGFEITRNLFSGKGLLEGVNILKSFDKVKGLLGNLVKPEAGNLLASMGLQNFDPKNTAAPGTAPTPAVAVGAGGGGSNVNVQVNSPITVPPGTPPSLVGESVRQGVNDAMSESLRKANLATKPQKAY